MGPAIETAIETETWVGRPLARFEDEALLRGLGRFMDDLDPFRTRVTRPSSARCLRTPASGGWTRLPRSSFPA